ncbi:MAG: substrate-binding domain-containing protein [Anaerolineales bacterium]
MSHRLLIAFGGLVLLSACSSATDQSILNIAVSPSAQPVSDAILACASTSGEVFTTIDILYAGTFELADYDLFIRLGESDEEVGAILPLAKERVGVAVNNGLSLGSVNRNALVEILTGRISSWSDLGGPEEPLIIWVGPESDDARGIIEEELLRGAPIAGNARVAPNPSALLDSVATDPGSIGILPAAWADERVDVIDLGIEVPVLAISANELEPEARDLLACLQGSTGQAVLSERYAPID